MPTNGWRDADDRALAELPERVEPYEDDLIRQREQEEVRGQKEPRLSEPHSPVPHSEDIRKIQVDDEDRLAFRVGVNALTLILLGFGIWLLITYVL